VVPFRLDEAIPLLRRTPAVLDALLRDLPEAWLQADEGPDTWNPEIVVGHLVHGERTDWMPRVRHILAHGDAAPFPPFDRFAQLREPARPLPELLATFATLRAEGLDELTGLALSQRDLARPGLHPALGEVTLGQLLATWVVHDLTHLYQVERVMARRYTDSVGPWRQYLRIVQA
jgi:hypothetical protein